MTDNITFSQSDTKWKLASISDTLMNLLLLLSLNSQFILLIRIGWDGKQQGFM